MARTKRPTIIKSPPRKRAKSSRGEKFASDSSSPPTAPSSVRPVVGLLSPRATPDKAASASRALADGYATLHQQTLDLIEELAHERFKVEAME
ncbi:hypothetical protein LIER_17535 [Lithospermum erythrorhizon]|uniref:Uncharacterized protein n=1 Tax=Lithospermum erythrorhizon TaxID=34254 RepID=A0AAV3QD25_LITER